MGRLGCTGLRVGVGEVAGAGADGELADAFRFGFDADSAIASLADGLGRVISQDVLMANSWATSAAMEST